MCTSSDYESKHSGLSDSSVQGNEWIFQVGCQGPLTQVYRNWNTSLLPWYCLLGESHLRKASLRPSPSFSLPDRGRPRGSGRRCTGRPEMGHRSGEAESSQLRQDNGEDSKSLLLLSLMCTGDRTDRQGSISCRRNCALKFSQKLPAKPLSSHLWWWKKM